MPFIFPRNKPYRFSQDTWYIRGTKTFGGWLPGAQVLPMSKSDQTKINNQHFHVIFSRVETTPQPGLSQNNQEVAQSGPHTTSALGVHAAVVRWTSHHMRPVYSICTVLVSQNSRGGERLQTPRPKTNKQHFPAVSFHSTRLL